MKRDLFAYLESWCQSPGQRKPLLIRGARQVGKSFLVRQLGETFDSFVEINFELSPGLSDIFQKNLDPVRIIRDLAIAIDKDIIPGKTLLFLDEIQECPKAIIALRYFFENMPELHVIAAGSLIEFALEQVGLPVGRVIPLRLYPLSFLEFLSATGNQRLRKAIYEHDPTTAFPESIHNKMVSLLGEYLAVGGMPEAVKKWVETNNIKECAAIHRFLIETYRQDFSKYARKNQLKYVENVFDTIPRLIGKKFVFSEVSQEMRSRELRPALELLSRAGVAHTVFHSSANGVPLGSEVNFKFFKVILADIALAQTVLGLNTGQWILNPHQCVNNLGAITEAFVGQEILAYSAPNAGSQLYYWGREKKGSMAELDYVTAVGSKVIPIEVKSGITGSAKSLNLFLKEKKDSPYGIKFSLRPYHMGERIKEYPLYAIASALPD